MLLRPLGPCSVFAEAVFLKEDSEAAFAEGSPVQNTAPMKIGTIQTCKEGAFRMPPE